MHSFDFSTSDGKRLYVEAWRVAKPKAALLIIHGYGEHIGRYAEQAKWFNSQQMDVYGYDHRAHGKSEGTRAYIESIAELANDLKSMVSYLQPNVPLYIWGHSMGGQVVVRYCLDHDVHSRQHVAGLLLTGALIRISPTVSPILQKLAKPVAQIFPRLKTNKLPLEHISKVKAVQTAYANDSLVYRGGTYALSGWKMIEGCNDIAHRLSDMSLPMLVMHGGEDLISDVNGSKALYEVAKAEDKTLKIWQGLRHEFFRSEQSGEILSMMSDWIADRTK